MMYIVEGKYRKLHKYEKIFNFFVKTMLQMPIILIIICYFHIYLITVVGTEWVFYSHLQLSSSFQYLANYAPVMLKMCTEMYVSRLVKWVLFLICFIKLKIRLCDTVWPSSSHQ